MSKATESHAGRTAVYWFHDDRGALLYVGITNSPKSRWAAHSHTQVWWDEVRTRTIEWFDTRAEAAAVEARCIHQDMPIHNISAGVPAGAVILGGVQRAGMTYAKDFLGTLVKDASEGTPTILMRNRRPLAVLVGYEQMREHLPE